MGIIRPITCSKWLLFFVIISIFSCDIARDKNRRESQEIMAVEKEFIEKVREWGVRDAFVYFADDSAVLLRNNRLVKGKREIEAYYDQSSFQGIKLVWEPEFVEVTRCGDLAYTYGPYTYSSKDSTGNEMVSRGIFHTIWKKQKDGSWKYVFD